MGKDENGAAAPMKSDEDAVELIAYRIGPDDGAELVTAPVGRIWMDETRDRFANRCLPLLIANQSGWLVLNARRVHLTWDGGPGMDAVTVEYDAEPPRAPVLAHFGGGVVTWSLPYLFRTAPGWNLHVRGPANCPKDGVYALEGVVETDWATATFTMNWHLTRPGLTVTFEEAEPICMITPQRRGDLARVRPSIRSLDRAAPELRRGLHSWMSSRNRFYATLRDLGREGPGWQRHYFQGRSVEGDRFEQHQTRLTVQDFVDETAPAAGQPPGRERLR